VTKAPVGVWTGPSTRARTRRGRQQGRARARGRARCELNRLSQLNSLSVGPMERQGWPFARFGAGLLVAAGTLAIGYLGLNTVFATPAASIRLVDGEGRPIVGQNVTRRWRHLRQNRSGSDEGTSGSDGWVRFNEARAPIRSWGRGRNSDYAAFTIFVIRHGTRRLLPPATASIVHDGPWTVYVYEDGARVHEECARPHQSATPECWVEMHYGDYRPPKEFRQTLVLQ
jgi:hypothetical protein